MATGIIIDARELTTLIRDLNIIKKDFPKLGEKIRRRLGHRTKALAKENVIPKWPAGFGVFKYSGSTGKLKNSIILRKESATTTQIVAEVIYADIVERGTTPHRIPGNFYWGVRGRNHPGARPMHFMQKAFRQISREADGLIGEEVNKFFSERKF